ncbi:glycosyltransferase [Vibrio furnissii]|uniref:glycosyltransferase n=1 Tax=Vibrio furnissii TaxID=29494 RepID=UPI0024B8F5AE|nr:glycosyltransferase [Vibrio furnissii]WHR51328.1 glycosyltransferase [Vibrio furnissii]
MNILPIVVLYKSSIKDSQAIKFLQGCKDISKIFVHDNTPSDNKNESYSIEKISYVHDNNNPGVSSAYNEGAKFAKEHGYDWLLLLDQDTTIDQGLIDAYFQAKYIHKNIKLFSPKLITKGLKPCSPCRVFIKRGFPIKVDGIQLLPLARYSPINSGMLIEVDTFLSVNGYDERVFLDFSDFQFIERLSNKINEFCVLDYTLIQDFSNDSIDKNSLKFRFDIYCACALACNKKSRIDLYQFDLTVFIRTLMLLLRTKDSYFLRSFYLKYWILR